jgi:hypothetical protein
MKINLVSKMLVVLVLLHMFYKIFAEALIIARRDGPL